MDAHFDTLAAWADGEPVDRAAVLHALDTAEGRDYVVDLMALRRVVTITTPMAGTAAADRSHTAGASRARRWMLPAAAAAVVCLAAGYAAGRVSGQAAPVAAPEVIPAGAPASSSAPAPTHVIRFEAGVDWRETAGGN